MSGNGEERRRRAAVALIVGGREAVAQSVCSWIDASLRI